MGIEIAKDQLGLEIDSWAAITAWQGEAMDYAMAVAAVIGRGSIGLE